jgi:hypothetical protein
LGVHISVDAYGAAAGSVSGVGGPISSILTASGTGTCALANGAVVILGTDQDPGNNPSLTSTPGSYCQIYDGTVEYTLTGLPPVWLTPGVGGGQAA